MKDMYKTVRAEGTAEFTVDGSGFIGLVSPATTEEETQEFVDKARKEYPDATHHVHAYRVRSEDGTTREKYDDDGEPSGSAGKPILNVFQKEEIQNAVAAVVRYYGGTKLGYGGLVRSYSRATKGALEDAGTTEQEPQEAFRVRVGYDDSGTARGVLESLESDGVGFDADYSETVTFDVRAPERNADEVRDRLLSATSGRAEID